MRRVKLAPVPDRSLKREWKNYPRFVKRFGANNKIRIRGRAGHGLGVEDTHNFREPAKVWCLRALELFANKGQGRHGTAERKIVDIFHPETALVSV